MDTPSQSVQLVSRCNDLVDCDSEEYSDVVSNPQGNCWIRRGSHHIGFQQKIHDGSLDAMHVSC